MADKLRQIQKFVEILSGLVQKSTVLSSKKFTSSGDNDNRGSSSSNDDDTSGSANSLRILDMGSGLAYLTFALHSHFSKEYKLHTIGSIIITIIITFIINIITITIIITIIITVIINIINRSRI